MEGGKAMVCALKGVNKECHAITIVLFFRTMCVKAPIRLTFKRYVVKLGITYNARLSFE